MSNMKVSAPGTLSISSSGSIVEDFYNAVSIRISSVANRRPVWSVHCTVDQISFYIGAIGGVGMGYLFNQYERPNVANPPEEQREENRPANGGLLHHIITYPLQIIHRFFYSGFVYVLIGVATNRILQQDGWIRPLVCGCFTGLYFSAGRPLNDMVFGTFGSGAFAVLMEAFFYLATR